TIATIPTTQQAPTLPTTAPSTLLQDLPNFGSLFGFENQLKTLEANFSEFMQMNQFAGAVSAILGITSYDVFAYLSEMELKKILIEKMEGNKDVNINQGRGIQTTQEVEDSHVTLIPVNPDGQQQTSSVSSQFVTSMLNPTPDAGMESIFEITLQMDAQTPISLAPLPMSAPTLTSFTIATIPTTQQAPTLPTTAPSTLLQDLPNFGSLFGFENQLKTLEANFSEFMQMNQFAGAVSA
nr:hypothetical protein [Tanacetum cinerariifolium]